MAETTKVFTGKLEFTTNLATISKEIDKFSKGMGKVQFVDPKAIAGLNAAKVQVSDLMADIKAKFADLPNKTAPEVYKLKEQFAGLKKEVSSMTLGTDTSKITASMQAMSAAVEKTFYAQAAAMYKVKSARQELASVEELAALKEKQIIQTAQAELKDAYANKYKSAKASAEVFMAEMKRLDEINAAREKQQIETSKALLKEAYSQKAKSAKDSAAQFQLGMLAENMDKTMAAGGAATNNLRTQLDGLYLAMTKNGNAAQGVREIFFGTAASTNSLAQRLDALAQKSLGFGTSQTKLQGQMEKLANAADMSARAMTLSGKSFQATIYESLGAGAAQMTQPFLQQVGRVQKAIESVGKNASLGKDTTTQLRQAQIAVQGLENEYRLLRASGIIPTGSAADVAFQKMITQAKNAQSQVQGMSARYEQTRKSVDDTKKSTDGLSASTQKSNTIFGSLSISLKNMFNIFKSNKSSIDNTTTSINNIKPALDSVNSKVEQTGNIFKSVFGGAFLGSLLGNLSSQLTNIFAGVGQQFYDLNSLVQNTNITIEGMLTGSSVNAKDAIAGFTTYVKDVVAQTPFEFKDAIDASLKLVQQGFDPQKWLVPAANAAAAMNKPMEQFIGGLTKIANGARGAGVDMLRDFGLNVNAISGMVDDGTGKLVKMNLEFDKQGSLITDTGTTMKILNAYLSQNATFANAASSRSKSLSGVISNLKDNFSSMLLAIGQPVFDKLTTGATSLLTTFNGMMPTITAIATGIGQSLGTAIDFASSLIFNFKGTVDGLIPSLGDIGYVVQAMVNGDWATAWNGAQVILSNVLTAAGSMLLEFGSNAMDWGYSFVDQIASGIIDAANGALQDAMNYVGNTISSFLEPGSPPKKGPLSTIDKWGSGVMGVFNEGMASASNMPFVDGVLKAMLALQVAQNKVSAGNKKVASIQKEIAKAEEAGYVPQELKDKLAIAQDGVKLAETEVAFRKEQLQYEQQIAKQESVAATDKSGGSSKTASKSNDAMAKASEKAAKAVKQTWQEAYADNLAQLEEKRKMGIVSEEEYLKEMLKLEQNYVDSSLKEGVSAGLDDHIAKIKDYQQQIAAMKPVKPGKGAGLYGDYKPASVDEIFGNFAKMVPKKLADVASEAGDKFVANIQVKFKSAFSAKTVGTMVSGLFDNLKKYLTPDKLPFIAGGAGLVGLIVGPKIGVAIASLGSLASTIGALAVAAAPWVAAATAITLIIMNWDKILPVIEPIWKGIVTQVTNFVNAAGGIKIIQANLDLLWNGITTAGKLAWDIVKGIATDLVNFDFAGAIGKLGSIGSVFNFSGISIPWSNLVTALTTGWNTYITPIFADWQKKAVTWLVGAWANAPTAITWLLNQISTFLETSWPTIYAGLATWIPKVWGWVQQAALGAGVALNGLLLTFSAWAASGEGQTAIIRFGDNLGKFIIDAISLLFKSSNGASSVIGTLLASLGAAALQLAFIAANVGVRLVQGIINGMMTQIGGVNWKDTIVAPILEALIMAFTPVGLITAFNETFGKVIAAVKAYLGIASPSTVFMEIGTDLIMGLVGGLTNMVPTLLSSAGDIAGKLISSIKTALGLDAGIGGVASSLFGGATAAPAPTENMQVAPTDMTQSTAAIATFASQAGPIIMNIQNLFINLKNEILNTFDAFSTKFVGGFIALDSTLSDATALIKTHVVSGFVSMTAEVILNVKSIADKSFSVINSVKWEDLGLAICQGLANGIEQNKHLVLIKLRQMAEEALSAAKHDLGIASPSTKFAEIGFQSMEGLVKGLEGGTNDVLHTTRDTMEKIVKTFAKQEFGRGAVRGVRDFMHTYGDAFNSGLADLVKAGNLNMQTLDAMSLRVIGNQGPRGRLIRQFGQQLIDEYTRVYNETNLAYVKSEMDKASKLLSYTDDITTKMDDNIQKLKVSAAETANELTQMADADIDPTKLNEMMATIRAGGTYGVELDGAITEAWHAQDKLNGALEEQQKMQADLLKIEESRQKIDLMQQQLDLASMIKENNLNGAEVMQGLQLGAEASVSDVTAAIARALEQMVANAQGALGIASPSKVFESMGLNIGAGLDKGVLASLANVKATMMNMGNFTLDALASGLNTGGAALNATGLDKLGGNMGMTQNNEFNTTINDKIDLNFFKRFILDTVSQGIK